MYSLHDVSYIINSVINFFLNQIPLMSYTRFEHFKLLLYFNTNYVLVSFHISHFDLKLTDFDIIPSESCLVDNDVYILLRW